MDEEQIVNDLEELKNGMFATRASIDGGYEFATRIIKNIEKNDQIYAMTAIHVLLNSVADHFLKLLEE